MTMADIRDFEAKVKKELDEVTFSISCFGCCSQNFRDAFCTWLVFKYNFQIF